MTHDASHDPTVAHGECFVCADALTAAFIKLADLNLGPRDAARLIAVIRRLALEVVANRAAV